VVVPLLKKKSLKRLVKQPLKAKKLRNKPLSLLA
jgi:hypothetical protein